MAVEWLAAIPHNFLQQDELGDDARRASETKVFCSMTVEKLGEPLI